MGFDTETIEAIKDSVQEALEQFFNDPKTDDLKGKTGGCDLWVRYLPNGKVRIDIEVMDQTTNWKAKEVKAKETKPATGTPVAAGSGPKPAGQK